jgi:hypothetical protein
MNPQAPRPGKGIEGLPDRWLGLRRFDLYLDCMNICFLTGDIHFDLSFDLCGADVDVSQEHYYR